MSDTKHMSRPPGQARRSALRTLSRAASVAPRSGGFAQRAVLAELTVAAVLGIIALGVVTLVVITLGVVTLGATHASAQPLMPDPEAIRQDLGLSQSAPQRSAANDPAANDPAANDPAANDPAASDPAANDLPVMAPYGSAGQPAEHDGHDHDGHDHDGHDHDGHEGHNHGSGATPASVPAGASERLLPPVPAGEPAVEVHVRVATMQAGFDAAPEAGELVTLSVIRPPHEVLGVVRGRTNADGVAVLRVSPGAGLQAFASVARDGREVFSAGGVRLDGAGRADLEILDYPVVLNDASAVFASRLIMIAELWEDYIVFTQIWTLQTDRPVIARFEGEGRSAGLVIPLPEDATGIRVVRPQERAEVVGRAVHLLGDVSPAGVGEEGPSLIVRFSIKHGNASRLRWQLPLAFDIENASVVVPQRSNHRRHPELDVRIDVPLCGEERVDGEVCFEELTDQAAGVQMLEGVAVRVARGGRGRAGDVMEVLTVGWPAAPRVDRVVAIGSVLVALLFGVVLWWRELRRSRRAGGHDARDVLLAQRARLLDDARALEQRLAEARILEADYAVEREGLVAALALVERRLREVAGEPGAAVQGAAKDAADGNAAQYDPADGDASGFADGSGIADGSGVAEASGVADAPVGDVTGGEDAGASGGEADDDRREG